MRGQLGSVFAVSAVAGVTALFGLGCSGPGTADGSLSAADIAAELAALPQYPQMALCAQSNDPNVASCHAHVRTDSLGAPASSAAPQGYGPADLKSAYSLPSSGANGAVLAIVDAMDDPNAEADLAVYRQQYGLPPCTTANGCFKKVNQTGQQGSYPTADPGWAGEISLDLDMASAVCPDCGILLVEANSASMNDLGTAENTAVSLGAVAVSNSFGGPESAGVSQMEATYFHHPGVAIFASAGDQGYGVGFPASSQFVTAVGGTTLARSSRSNRGWIEGVWGDAQNSNGGTGSGCSGVIPKPSWQKDPGCQMRMEADVSAVGDPNTGMAVYDSYGQSGSGWLVAGGTSAAAPIVAGIYVLTGHGKEDPSFSYRNTAAFNDVIAGANGTCSPAYLCSAQAGYDGPTGNGTPNGQALLAIAGPASFSLGLSSGSLATTAGGSAQGSVTATATSGNPGLITLSAVGLPTGIAAAFSPDTINPGGTSTLTLTVDSSVTAGSYAFTIVGGTSSSAAASTAASLQIN